MESLSPSLVSKILFYSEKVDDDHLVTSGEQTVLTIKDNKVQLDIPETTDRKAGNPIEAYAIQGTTTTSPVVAVFPKDETAPVEEKSLQAKEMSLLQL